MNHGREAEDNLRESGVTSNEHVALIGIGHAILAVNQTLQAILGHLENQVPVSRETRSR